MKKYAHPNKHYIVTLTSKQKRNLQQIIKSGTEKARVVRRAQALLAAHEEWSDAAIADCYVMDPRTVRRLRERCVDHGPEAVLYDTPRSGRPPTITDEDEAFLVATACSPPPEGTEHWTLELLQQTLRDKRGKKVTEVSIWYRLDHRGIKPWREKNVVYHGGDT